MLFLAMKIGIEPSIALNANKHQKLADSEKIKASLSKAELLQGDGDLRRSLYCNQRLKRDVLHILALKS